MLTILKITMWIPTAITILFAPLLGFSINPFQDAGIPTLDPSSNATVLAWGATLAVSASVFMFTLLYRHMTKAHEERWKQIQTHARRHGLMLLALIRALAMHPNVEIDMAEVLRQLEEK